MWIKPTSRVGMHLGERKVAYEEKKMMVGLTFMAADKIYIGVVNKKLMAHIDAKS